jgi:hypothetical protein
LPGLLLLRIGKSQKPYNNLLAKARNLTTLGGKSQKSYKNLNPTATNNHHGKITIA